MDLTGKKILVTYFSHAGENYFGGKIVNITKGNTHVLAEIIAEMYSADLFEIKTNKKYAFKYAACTQEAKEELKENARPKLADDIDISKYDVIILGFPNWWGTMPMPVCTFLEKHNFEGKIVLPFCTHEGSEMGKSEQDLANIIPLAIRKKGLPVRGSKVKEAESAVAEWIENI